MAWLEDSEGATSKEEETTDKHKQAIFSGPPTVCTSFHGNLRTSYLSFFGISQVWKVTTSKDQKC